MLENLQQKGYQVETLHHAEAILTHDMPDAVTEIESVLLKAQIPAEELVRGGVGNPCPLLLIGITKDIVVI